MRQRFLKIYFAILVISGLFGCEKEDPMVLSRSELITSNTWVFKGVKARGVGDLATVLAIEYEFSTKYKGTEMKFNDDGTATWKQLDGSVYNGIWYFNQDLTVITAAFENMASEDYTIIELTSSVMVVKVNIDDVVAGATIEITLQRK